MKSRVLGGVLAASLLAGSVSVKAEDIDLFVQPAGNTGLPNVLLMVDNTGNWSAPFNNEIAALVQIFNNLATNTDGTRQVSGRRDVRHRDRRRRQQHQRRLRARGDPRR